MIASRSTCSSVTAIIMNHSPGDQTDLSTLTGPDDVYKKLVEILFSSEFGSVKLGYILLTSQDEFLNEYGKSPQIKSLLRAWIAEYSLSERFVQKETSEFG